MGKRARSIKIEKIVVEKTVIDAILDILFK